MNKLRKLCAICVLSLLFYTRVALDFRINTFKTDVETIIMKMDSRALYNLRIFNELFIHLVKH